MNTKYLVISNTEGQPLGDHICSFTGVCNNFKKAYEISLFLSAITSPDISYRAALKKMNRDSSVTITQGEKASTILITKTF
jgi:hypothetical protein